MRFPKEKLSRFVEMSGCWREEYEQAWDGELTDRVIADLCLMADCFVTSLPPHYGCGTASYRDVFIARDADVDELLAKSPLGSQVPLAGLAIYICEIEPISVWSQQIRHFIVASHRDRRHLNRSAYGFLEPSHLFEEPSGFEDIIADVTAILAEHGFSMPAVAELVEGLPFKADIGTMLPACREPGDPHETLVFDALFFYSD